MSMLTLKDWQSRQQQWRRFQEWERTYLRGRPNDLAAAIRWFSDAAALAAGMDPEWGSERRMLGHVRHLGRIRAALSVLAKR